MKIAVAKGDGIGPEIMDAVLKIFEANKVPLEYEYVEMGKWVFDKGFSNGMTPGAKMTIENLGILFKGPMETPKGKGVKSVNVTARKTWNTYANKRVFQTLHGVDTVFSKAGIPIDITVVRENIEDTYGGIEHMLTHDVALSRRFITRPGSLQVIKYAFEMAKQKNAKRITCGHKANIMKITDGLFLDCFYEVAKEYPELKSDDVIVDDLCMKLVTRPDTFDVMHIRSSTRHSTGYSRKKYCKPNSAFIKRPGNASPLRLYAQCCGNRKCIAVYTRTGNSYWRFWR
jgi:isocitrate dehydrogenase